MIIGLQIGEYEARRASVTPCHATARLPPIKQADTTAARGRRREVYRYTSTSEDGAYRARLDSKAGRSRAEHRALSVPQHDQRATRPTIAPRINISRTIADNRQLLSSNSALQRLQHGHGHGHETDLTSQRQCRQVDMHSQNLHTHSSIIRIFTNFKNRKNSPILKQPTNFITLCFLGPLNF